MTTKNTTTPITETNTSQTNTGQTKNTATLDDAKPSFFSSWRIIAILAWRYLWRNHRRTIIMLCAIAIGVWAMIFMVALMRGMVDDMIQNSIKTFVGHVQIHHPEYRDDPSVVNRMAAPSVALKKVFAEENLHWSTRVRVPAVVSSERESLGVMLMGVSAERESILSHVADWINEGRWLDSDNDRGIVIGEKLAKRLDTRLGKRIVIMSQDPDNNIADRGFKIVGIYKAELSSIEEQFVFVGITTLQTLLNIGDSISEIEVQGSSFRNVDGFYKKIKSIENTNSVATWYDLNSYLGTMLSVMDGFVFIWIVVIFLALSFGLMNTLVMAVFERVREIGLILALGMRPSGILKQVLLETLFLLLIGLLFGNILVLLSIYPIREGFDVSHLAEGMEMMGAGTTIRPALYLNDVLLANGIVVVLGLLSGVLPALRASRYNPVTALNKV
ncbi:MAG: ABC transporter permease [Cellvibrionaceae bacterium]